jgi:hypothetical protein
MTAKNVTEWPEGVKGNWPLAERLQWISHQAWHKKC